MNIAEVNFNFDTKKLKEDLDYIVSRYGWGDLNQISLRHTGKFSTVAEQVREGCGSLYDRDSKLLVGQESDYTYTCEFVNNLYIGKVLQVIEHFASNKIGRARFMLLPSKTCYSWHKDLDERRYHVPIVTNPQCMFVTEGDQVLKMPKEGQLYTLTSNVWHTALNASWKDRIHLVVSTW